MTNHQRVGAVSNAHAGREFEDDAREYFKRDEGLDLESGLSVQIGVGSLKKPHAYDLGSQSPPILVECKSHNWTETGNMPSAKVTVWNEAMYFFHLAPVRYRKILFVLWAQHPSRKETLAEYYLRLYSYLIPQAVSVLEYDPSRKKARYLRNAV
jgi:hypothetical protein